MVAVTAPDVAAKGLDYRAMLKEAGLTALAVLVIAFTMDGIEVRDVPGGLDIHTRFPAVAVAVALVFVGRIALILLRRERPLPVLAVGVLFSGSLLALLLLDMLLPESETSAAANTTVGNRVFMSSPPGTSRTSNPTMVKARAKTTSAVSPASLSMAR